MIPVIGFSSSIKSSSISAKILKEVLLVYFRKWFAHLHVTEIVAFGLVSANKKSLRSSSLDSGVLLDSPILSCGNKLCSSPVIKHNQTQALSEACTVISFTPGFLSLSFLHQEYPDRFASAASSRSFSIPSGCTYESYLSASVTSSRTFSSLSCSSIFS